MDLLESVMAKGKGIAVAKQIVLAKIASQNQMLKSLGLRQLDLYKVKSLINGIQSDNPSAVRKKLLAIEGHESNRYFKQIFLMFPKGIRVENRSSFKAYDGLNNTFNLVYAMLKWKVHRAILKAKLEPYLGFLHSEQFAKPSLVCDFMELYRYLVDGFLIEYCKTLRKRDFSMKVENFSKHKKGKREYLNDSLTSDLSSRLTTFFESKVDIPRIMHGQRQSVETLINEEALLFG